MGFFENTGAQIPFTEVGGKYNIGDILRVKTHVCCNSKEDIKNFYENNGPIFKEVIALVQCVENPNTISTTRFTCKGCYFYDHMDDLEGGKVCPDCHTDIKEHGWGKGKFQIFKEIK